MAEFHLSQQSSVPKGDENFEKTYNELIKTLPKAIGWTIGGYFLYKGAWLIEPALRGALLLPSHFKARSADVFLAAFPKCGTTWLRALLFATTNRACFNFSDHPLLTTGPHDCFPYLDFYEDLVPGVESLPSPRLFATHFPYNLLPESAIACGCKFVYIWRDPKDTFLSYWHFFNNIKDQGVGALSLDKACESFCEGYTYCGPFWDHVLGYWKASVESPDKILCLRYEDLKREPNVTLKRMAEFIGLPFSFEEERDGVVQDILKLCSFENLSNLEVNKTGVMQKITRMTINNDKFFRKGKIGDFKNYLTNEMILRLDNMTAQKFQGSGLSY